MQDYNYLSQKPRQLIHFIRALLTEPFRLQNQRIERLPMVLCYAATLIWLIRIPIILAAGSSPEDISQIYPLPKYTWYLFLPWNLFLAWIPFAISRFMQPGQNSLFFWLLLGIWLLFFPNAPYLLTDFIHFGDGYPMPIWVELSTFFLFAAGGLALGFSSLYHIHFCLRQRYNRSLAWFSISLVLFLAAIGIYLGRVVRFNSWDALLNPSRVLETAIQIGSDPDTLPFFFLFSAIAFHFLLFSYLLVYYLRQKNWQD